MVALEIIINNVCWHLAEPPQGAVKSSSVLSSVLSSGFSSGFSSLIKEDE